MTTPLSYIDPDPQIAIQGPTLFKTERNQHEVRCGLCGRITYVAADTFSFGSDAIKAGLDDPFRCEVYKEEVRRSGPLRMKRKSFPASQ